MSHKAAPPTSSAKITMPKITMPKFSTKKTAPAPGHAPAPAPAPTPAPAPAPTPAPAPAAPFTYYFVPYLGVQQQPQAPFHWTTNVAQNCSAQGSKCLGYDYSNNVFDSGILNPKGAKLTYQANPQLGSYFKDPTVFAAICTQHLGGQLSSDQKKCNLTAQQAQSAMQKLSTLGNIAHFDGGNFETGTPSLLMLMGLVLLIVFLIRRGKKH